MEYIDFSTQKKSPNCCLYCICGWNWRLLSKPCSRHFEAVQWHVLQAHICMEMAGKYRLFSRSILCQSQYRLYSLYSVYRRTLLTNKVSKWLPSWLCITLSGKKNTRNVQGFTPHVGRVHVFKNELLALLLCSVDPYSSPFLFGQALSHPSV